MRKRFHVMSLMECASQKRVVTLCMSTSHSNMQKRAVITRCFVGSRLRLASSRLGSVRNVATSDHTAGQTIEQ
jgi:hypothetical protein